MRLVLKRLARPVIAALAVAVAFAAVAPAATTPVTFKLKGEYAKRERNACGKRKHFRLYHRRSMIEWEGFVTPHPAGHFRVILEVKRCAGGHRLRFHSYQALGKKLTGKYKGFLRADGLAPRSHRRNAIIYYVARVKVNSKLSRKVFFAVTN